MFRVNFVCTANICRSPLAEAILKGMIHKENLESVLLSESCGVWASDGQSASSLIQMVAEENGLDLSRHRSQAVNLPLMKQSDLVLCMTPSHKRDLIHVFPHFEKKIFTLKEFVNPAPPPNLSVDDPIGMNLNFYRRIYNEIHSEISRILPEIKNLVSSVPQD